MQTPASPGITIREGRSTEWSATRPGRAPNCGPFRTRWDFSATLVRIHSWAADSGTEEIRGAEYEQDFARSMSLDQILERNPILAWEMNGDPLTAVHGFPVRLIVPGWYGVAQVKWLERIEASADRLKTRFTAKDYVTLMGQDVDGETEWDGDNGDQASREVRHRARDAGGRSAPRILGVAWSTGRPSARSRCGSTMVSGGWRRSMRPPILTRGRTSHLKRGGSLPASTRPSPARRGQPENLDLKRTR